MLPRLLMGYSTTDASARQCVKIVEGGRALLAHERPTLLRARLLGCSNVWDDCQWLPNCKTSHGCQPKGSINDNHDFEEAAVAIAARPVAGCQKPRYRHAKCIGRLALMRGLDT